MHQGIGSSFGENGKVENPLRSVEEGGLTEVLPGIVEYIGVEFEAKISPL